MQALLNTILQALAAHVQNAAGCASLRGDFRLARMAPLACRSFVWEGAGEAAAQMHTRRESCLWMGAPLLKTVRAENGWILFVFTDAFYTALCKAIIQTAYSPARAGDEAQLYLVNRLRIWARRGPAPCPAEPNVQRALWIAFYDSARFGRLQGDAQRAVLSMTHHADGLARIALEGALGSVAAALLHLAKQ